MDFDPDLGKKKKKKKNKDKDDGFGGGDYGGDYGGNYGGDVGGLGGALDDFGGGGLGRNSGDMDFGGGGGLGRSRNNSGDFGGGFGGGGLDDYGGGLGGSRSGLDDYGGGLDYGRKSPKGNRSPRSPKSYGNDRFDMHDGLGEAPSLDRVLAKEREIRQQLERESDKFSEAVRTERAQDQRLEQEVNDLQRQSRELEDRERKLRSDVDDAKAQLQAAREAHRGTDLQDLTASADRGHVQDELEFLNRKAEDDEKTLNFMSNSNQQLERHNEDLRQQVLRLERERKIIGAEVTTEREQAKQEARQVAELRNRVEQLRRQRVANHQQNLHEERQKHELNKIKQGAVAPAVNVQGHSWAGHVSTPGGQQVNAPGPPLGGRPVGPGSPLAPQAPQGSPLAGSPQRGIVHGLRGSGAEF